MKWTANKVENLKRRWDAGETASTIACAMHVSRNAVIGKLNRLGLIGKMSDEERGRRCRWSEEKRKKLTKMGRDWLANLTPAQRDNWHASLLAGRREAGK